MMQTPLPRISGYKNIHILSQKGGMGDIFRAEDAKTGQEVVIKMMKLPENPEETEQLLRMSGMFRWDTDIPMTLDHPHILKALKHGYVTYQGYDYPYLVYPYIKDRSVQDLARTEHPWSNPNWSLLQIADIVIQAAEGLYHLHQKEPPIVHQDIKPANLLWRYEYAKGPERRVHIWISDFGTARWELPVEHKTSPIGTPPFMAPEQFDGMIRRTTDQYALAIVARYLLTGHQPGGHIPPPSEKLRDPAPTALNPTRLHNKEIDIVLLQALAENPDDRFPNVSHFAQRLKEAIVHQENPASLLLTHTPQLSSNIDQGAELTNHLSPTVPDMYHPLPEIFPDNPVVAPYDYHVVDNPLPVAPRQPVSEVVPAPLAYYPLHQLFRTALPGKPTMLSWSPHGECLLCTFFDAPPRLIYRDTHIEDIAGITGHAACWSPDGQHVAFSLYSRKSGEAIIQIWDKTKPARSTIHRRFSSNASIDGLAWSKRGQLAVWVNSRLLLYDMSRPELLSTFPEPGKIVSLPDMLCSQIGTLQWSPGGSLLALGAKNGALVCWDADRQEIHGYIAPSKAPIQSLAWFPDNSRLAAGFRNRRIAVWDMARNSELHSWNIPTAIPWMLSISPQDLIVTIATQKNLLFGKPDDGGQSLSTSVQGNLLASWSSAAELATLDKQDDTTLLILQKQ